MTRIEMEEYLRSEFGIESEKALIEAYRKSKIDIGAFTGGEEIDESDYMRDDMQFSA